RETRTTLAGRLAAESTDAAHQGHVDLAALLAMQAWRFAPSVSTRAALLTALTAQPTLEHELYGLSDEVEAASFSPDGTLVVAGDQHGTMIIWDVASGQRRTKLQSLGPSKGVSALRFTGDSGHVVGVYELVGANGAVSSEAAEWNVADGR